MAQVSTHGQALQQLHYANASIVKQMQSLLPLIEKYQPSEDIAASPDKQKALTKVVEYLPKYVSTLEYELQSNGQGRAGGVGVVPGASGDPASYK